VNAQETGTSTTQLRNGEPGPRPVQIALVLYPHFTALDIIGPFQVLAYAPGHEVVFVAAEAGPVADDTGRCQIVATRTFDEVHAPDVVVIGGTLLDAVAHRDVVDWLRRVHPTTTWTTSVCTGSLYLAAAGILDGLDATTHWARAGRLEELGAHYVAERVVQRGKVITAAGVSSGIDMALTLLDRMHGPQLAQLTQLGIEYDPEPPFQSGSPRTAPPELVPVARAALDAAAVPTG
jgi:transcriptional regulator GlxA family with amidase domain